MKGVERKKRKDSSHAMLFNVFGRIFFLNEQDEEMPLDSFLMYREHYRRVRDSLAGAILSDSIDELEASLEVIFLIVFSSLDFTQASVWMLSELIDRTIKQEDLSK